MGIVIKKIYLNSQNKLFTANDHIGEKKCCCKINNINSIFFKFHLSVIDRLCIVTKNVIEENKYFAVHIYNRFQLYNDTESVNTQRMKL